MKVVEDPEKKYFSLIAQFDDDKPIVVTTSEIATGAAKMCSLNLVDGSALTITDPNTGRKIRLHLEDAPDPSAVKPNQR